MAHIDLDCSELTGHFENETFFNCLFKRLNGLTLERCDLNRSKFTTDDIKDALGFTLTLSCLSFSNVEFSPLLFDLMLCLLLKSKNNDAKRRKLIDVIGRDRAHELLVEMTRLE